MKLLLMLIHWLFTHSFLLAFAAGPVIVPGGEAPVGEPPPEESEEKVEGEEPVEGEEEKEPVEGEEEKEKPETKVDLRTVSPEVKAHLAELSKTNSKLANTLQNALYTSASFLKECPGGIKEIQGLKNAIQEAGGLEEIKTMKSTYKALEDEQEALDTQAREGNPAVLDNLVDIAGDGFVKLMPHALDKWMDKDPDGYSHVMGKVMVSAMRDGGVIQDLNLAFKMLALNNEGATKEAVDALKRVAAWANKVGDVASKVPEKPKADPNLVEQQKSIDNQKAELFNRQFAGKFGPWRDSKIDELAKVHAKGRKLTDYQMNTLGRGVVSEVSDILNSDEDYKKSLNRIWATRDEAELLKFTKARYERLLPEAVKKVYRHLFTDATLGSKKKVETKPGERKRVEAAPVKGWVKVAADKAPKPDEIDNNKTDFKMKFNRQAILKDGKKVWWGDKAPAEA